MSPPSRYIVNARYLCIRGCTYTMYTGCCTCRYDASIGWISTSLGVGDASRHEATRAYNERLGVAFLSLPLLAPLPPARLPFCVRRRRAWEAPYTLFRRFYLRGNSKGDGQLYHQRRSLTGRRRDAATRRPTLPLSLSVATTLWEFSPRIRTSRIALPKGSLVSRFSPFQFPDSRFLRFSHAVVSFPPLHFCDAREKDYVGSR